MRKSLILSLAIISMLVFFDSSTYGLDVQAGVRYWFASWGIDNFKVAIADASFNVPPIEYYFPSYYDTPKDTNTDGTGIFGGSFTINLTPSLGFGLTYFSGSYDIKMRSTAEVQSEPQEGNIATYKTNYTLETSTDRTDLDVYGQYKYRGVFTFYVGFKHITYSYGKQTLDLDYEITDGTTTMYVDDLPTTFNAFEATYSGPYVGMGAFRQLEGGWFSFGSFSYMPVLIGGGDMEKLSSDNSGMAFNLEVGIGMLLPKAHLVPSFSYRYQYFWGFEDLTDTFHGVIVGVNAFF